MNMVVLNYLSIAVTSRRNQMNHPVVCYHTALNKYMLKPIKFISFSGVVVPLKRCAWLLLNTTVDCLLNFIDGFYRSNEKGNNFPFHSPTPI